MIERLLSAPIVSVEAFEDVPGEEPLAGEQHLVAGVAETRRCEFITARRCAREALKRLGHGPVPILSGDRRAPQWPDGIAGSITHCKGYRAAAVASTASVAAIGIDAEPHRPLPRGVEESVTLAEERDMLAELRASHPGPHWDKILFSAKESVYKAWFPLTGRWLGFKDARLIIAPDAARFRARLRVPGRRVDRGQPLTAMEGRFMTEGGLLLTAVTVPAATATDR